MTGYRDKRALVLGMGKSGESAARALIRAGAVVKMTDTAFSKMPDNMTDLARAGVDFVKWESSGSMAKGYDTVVVSPGVPINSAAINAAKRSGAEVIGELELAYRTTESPIIAVTGTNGKSTVVTMLGEIFSRAGVPNIVAGNIGYPLTDAAGEATPDTVLIAEVSSFQLETAIDFKPKIGVLLNITEDHMDRHGDMATYISAKAKLFSRQTADEFAVINLEDEGSAEVIEMVPSTVVPYSIYKKTNRGVFIDDNRVWAILPPEYLPVIDGYVNDFKIKGAHNLENILAAAAVALLWGIPADEVSTAIANFKGLKHRIEYAAEVNGVTFYDDSKATNPDAMKRALEAFTEPVILMAGGRNKGMDFTPLAPILKERVKAAVLFGEAADEIGAVIANTGNAAKIPFVKAASMREAVTAAYELADPGNVVLMSPGCASFDMYNSYAERGDDFQENARRLAREAEVNG
jgi:UDP-N-acetylmuramoylalanine--D-glutamate ligase